MTDPSSRHPIEVQRVPVHGGEQVALDLCEPPCSSPLRFLFLHGLGSHRRGEKITHLGRWLAAKGIPFAAFDARGHGDSDGRLSDWTPSRHLEDVGAVLEHLRRRWGDQRFLLVGSSLGGWAAAWFSARNPGAVAGQVLIAPAFRIVERYWERLPPALQERWREEGMLTFLGPWFEFQLSYRCVEEAADFSHQDLADRTTAPTWLVHGDQDESVPVQLSRDFAAQVPHVRLHVIPGGDHRLSAHRDRLADLLGEVLGELGDA